MKNENSINNSTLILERIKTLFPSIYLTLISVIQATAFGFFAYILYAAEWETILKVGGIDLIYLLIMIATAFLVLIAVWNEYMMGSTVLVWTPGPIDSLIPFCLGVSEVLTMHFIIKAQNLWLFPLVGLCLFSVWAFLNMYKKSRNEKDNALIFQAIENKTTLGISFIAVNFGYLFLAAFIFLSMGLIIFLLPIGNNVKLAVSAFALLIVLGFFIRSHYYWKTILRYLEQVRNAGQAKKLDDDLCCPDVETADL